MGINGINGGESHTERQSSACRCLANREVERVWERAMESGPPECCPQSVYLTAHGQIQGWSQRGTGCSSLVPEEPLACFFFVSLWGHPHTNSFRCKRMLCLIFANRPNGSRKDSACKCTSLKPGPRVKKFKNALVFSSGQQVPILSVSMMSFILTRMTPTQHFAAIHSPCGWVWVAAAVHLHYRATQTILVSLTGRFLTSCCVWLLLLSVCRQLRLFFPFLVNFCRRTSTTYKPSIWTTECWGVFNGSVRMRIF